MARGKKDGAAATDDDDDSVGGGGRVLSPTRSIRGRDDDMQSSGLGGSPPKGGTPGSTPLGDATLSQNSESGPSPGRPVKRRKGNRFVATEAEDEDGDDEQARPLSNLPEWANAHLLEGLVVAYAFLPCKLDSMQLHS